MKTIFLGFLCLLLTACGFHLRGQSDDAVSLMKVMFIQSPDPYGALSKTVRSVLKAQGVMLVDNTTQAPYRLEITKSSTGIRSAGYGFSNQVSVNTVTYSFDYRLWGCHNTLLIPWRTISSVRNFTINTNQALMGTVIPDYLLDDMRRSAANQLVEQLNAWKTNED